MRRYSAIADLVMRHHARKNIPYSLSLIHISLLDDIATLLDDISVMGKLAAKKTAGVLGCQNTAQSTAQILLVAEFIYDKYYQR